MPHMKKEYISKAELDAHNKLVNLTWSLGASLQRLERCQAIMKPSHSYLNGNEKQDQFIASTYLTYFEEELSIVKKMERDISAVLFKLGLNHEQNQNS